MTIDLDAIEKLAREALDVVASTNIQFDNDRLDRARYVPDLAKAVLELSEKLRIFSWTTNIADDRDHWRSLSDSWARKCDELEARLKLAEAVCEYIWDFDLPPGVADKVTEWRKARGVEGT